MYQSYKYIISCSPDQLCFLSHVTQTGVKSAVGGGVTKIYLWENREMTFPGVVSLIRFNDFTVYLNHDYFTLSE